MLERDPIPENFASIEEAAEFWENHSFADYSDELTEVEFEVLLPVRIEDDTLRKAKNIALVRGISVTKLINQWVKERVDYSPTDPAQFKAKVQELKERLAGIEEIPPDLHVRFTETLRRLVFDFASLVESLSPERGQL